MDGASPQKMQSPNGDLGVEQDKLDASTARYLTRVKPFSLRFDAPAPLMTQELALRWPVESGKEQQATNLRHQIENYMKPFIEHIHPAAVLRIVVNVGTNPEGQVAFPDAPALYAAFDAACGTIRHRLAAANEVPLDIWAKNITRGMTLLCQPVDNKTEQFAQALGQGGNMYELQALEQNETEDWRRAHNRSIIVPMMPPYAKSEKELTGERHYQEVHKSDISGPSRAALVGTALLSGEDVKEDYKEQIPAAAAANTATAQATDAAQNKADSEAMAQKNMDDAARQAEQAAMQRVEYLLNEVKRDERLIRENPQLSTELDALMGSTEQLRGTLYGGPMEAQAEADINNAQSEFMLAKEPETSYDESSNPEQIFMGMPEKETEVQESEQAREDAERFPEEITQAGEYARIADLNPDAAAELTAEEPGLEHAAVREDFLPAGADELHGNAERKVTVSGITQTAAETVAEEALGSGPHTTVAEAANAANEVTLSPQAAAEREVQTAPAAAASRAAQEIGGTREAPASAEATPLQSEAPRAGVTAANTEAAPQSEIDQPTAGPTPNIESRELSGGAPSDEAEQPLQNETPLARAEAREQLSSPAQEAPAQNPALEQVKEQIKDEMMRGPEPAQAPATSTPLSEHVETARNVEPMATPRETAMVQNTESVNQVRSEFIRTDASQPSNETNESTLDHAQEEVFEPTESSHNEAVTPRETTQQSPIQQSPIQQSPSQNSLENPGTEIVKEGMRDEVFQTAEPTTQYASAFDRASANVNAAAQGRETAAPQNLQSGNQQQPEFVHTSASQQVAPQQVAPQQHASGGVSEPASERAREEVFESAESGNAETTAPREAATAQNHEFDTKAQPASAATNVVRNEAGEPLESESSAENPGTEIIKEGMRDEVFRNAEPTTQYTSAFDRASANVNAAAQGREAAAHQNLQSGTQQQPEFVHTSASQQLTPQQDAPQQHASGGVSEPASERARQEVLETTGQESAPKTQSTTQANNAEPSTTFQGEPPTQTVRAENASKPAPSQRIPNTAEPSRFSGEPISNVTERSSAYADNQPSESVQQTEAPEPAFASSENTPQQREAAAPTTAEARAETPTTSLAAQPTTTVPAEPNALHTMLHIHHVAEALGTGGGFSRVIRGVPQAVSRAMAKTGLVKAKAVAATARPARQRKKQPVKTIKTAQAAAPSAHATPTNVQTGPLHRPDQTPGPQAVSRVMAKMGLVKAKMVAATARPAWQRKKQPVKTIRTAQAAAPSAHAAPTNAKMAALHRPDQTTEPHAEASPEAAPK